MFEADLNVKLRSETTSGFVEVYSTSNESIDAACETTRTEEAARL
jgi:hypothetical protein